MKKIIYIALSLLTLSACNKFLDTTPDNRTEIDNVEKLSQLVASSYPKACYAAMLQSRVDFVSDKGTGQENNSNSQAFFWRDVTDVSQDTPEYFWNKCYFSIASVNHALAAAEEMGITDEMKPYIGEAKVIRSFSHFLLLSLYSRFLEDDAPGVPYITEPENVVVQNYERGKVADVWVNAEKDLTEGLAMLGADAVYSVPQYHFTVAAANAYASRFYLYKGNWTKVIEHASKVISKPVVNEATGNVDATDAANVFAASNFQPWSDYYASVPSSNDIKNYYTKAENPSNLLLTEMSSRLSRYANTWRYGCSADDRTASYSAKNPTGGSWNYRIYSSSSTHYYVPKYREHFVKANINATTGTIYTIFPYFRVEEALLNRAEAYAMSDDFKSAIADLNVFCRYRIKSYSETKHVLTMDKILNVYKSKVESQDHFMNKYNAYGSAAWTSEKKALICFILDCRVLEFMWEGLRYWDLWRYSIPVTHETITGDKNTLYPGDDRWVLQIPETAKLSGIELNPRTNLLSKEW